MQQGRTAIFAPCSCTCCCSFIDCKEKWAALHFFPFLLIMYMLLFSESFHGVFLTAVQLTSLAGIHTQRTEFTSA